MLGPIVLPSGQLRPYTFPFVKVNIDELYHSYDDFTIQNIQTIISQIN